MTDEEKQAIEKLDYELTKSYVHNQGISKETLKLFKDIIEKQSKEIEELNKSDTSKEQSSMNYYNLYKELEDKIKAKIEELDKKYKEAYNKGFKTDMVNRLREIKLMQSLLEKE